MKITHHNLEFEFNDEWWVESEMVGFVPRSKAYHADHGTLRKVCEVLYSTLFTRQIAKL
jgi:hypothetical protein